MNENWAPDTCTKTAPHGAYENMDDMRGMCS